MHCRWCTQGELPHGSTVYGTWTRGVRGRKACRSVVGLLGCGGAGAGSCAHARGVRDPLARVQPALVEDERACSPRAKGGAPGQGGARESRFAVRARRASTPGASIYTGTLEQAPHELARDESAFGLQLSGVRRCGGRGADSDSNGRTVVRAADHEGRDLYAVERLPHELELGRLRVQRAAAAAPL